MYNTLCQEKIARFKNDNSSYRKSGILDTDASGTAIGAVLSQMQDDNEKVTAYMPVGVLLSQNVNTL